MSSDLLQEYKEYYSARARRYANNDKYRNTYEAESNLSNAMQSCSQLEEFRDKIGNLNELCAMALVKDEHLMEHAFYMKHEEIVRAKAAERILQRIGQCSNVTELITMVQEVSNENSLEISMDEWQREFQGDWSQIDDIEVYENAEVPSAYQDKMRRIANDTRQSIKESVAASKSEARKFKPDFEWKHEVNLESRHRRLLPYSDIHIQEQITKYKSILNS